MAWNIVFQWAMKSLPSDAIHLLLVFTVTYLCQVQTCPTGFLKLNCTYNCTNGSEGINRTRWQCSETCLNQTCSGYCYCDPVGLSGHCWCDMVCPPGRKDQNCSRNCTGVCVAKACNPVLEKCLKCVQKPSGGNCHDLSNFIIRSDPDNRDDELAGTAKGESTGIKTSTSTVYSRFTRCLLIISFFTFVLGAILFAFYYLKRNRRCLSYHIQRTSGSSHPITVKHTDYCLTYLEEYEGSRITDNAHTPLRRIDSSNDSGHYQILKENDTSIRSLNIVDFEPNVRAIKQFPVLESNHHLMFKQDNELNDVQDKVMERRNSSQLQSMVRENRDNDHVVQDTSVTHSSITEWSHISDANIILSPSSNSDKYCLKPTNDPRGHSLNDDASVVSIHCNGTIKPALDQSVQTKSNDRKQNKTTLFLGNGHTVSVLKTNSKHALVNEFVEIFHSMNGQENHSVFNSTTPEDEHIIYKPEHDDVNRMRILQHGTDQLSINCNQPLKYKSLDQDNKVIIPCSVHFSLPCVNVGFQTGERNSPRNVLTSFNTELEDNITGPVSESCTIPKIRLSETPATLENKIAVYLGNEKYGSMKAVGKKQEQLVNGNKNIYEFRDVMNNNGVVQSESESTYDSSTESSLAETAEKSTIVELTKPVVVNTKNTRPSHRGHEKGVQVNLNDETNKHARLSKSCQSEIHMGLLPVIENVETIEMIEIHRKRPTQSNGLTKVEFPAGPSTMKQSIDVPSAMTQNKELTSPPLVLYPMNSSESHQEHLADINLNVTNKEKCQSSLTQSSEDDSEGSETSSEYESSPATEQRVSEEHALSATNCANCVEDKSPTPSSLWVSGSDHQELDSFVKTDTVLSEKRKDNDSHPKRRHGILKSSVNTTPCNNDNESKHETCRLVKKERVPSALTDDHLDNERYNNDILKLSKVGKCVYPTPLLLEKTLLDTLSEETEKTVENDVDKGERQTEGVRNQDFATASSVNVNGFKVEECTKCQEVRSDPMTGEKNPENIILPNMDACETGRSQYIKNQINIVPVFKSPNHTNVTPTERTAGFMGLSSQSNQMTLNNHDASKFSTKIMTKMERRKSLIDRKLEMMNKQSALEKRCPKNLLSRGHCSKASNSMYSVTKQYKESKVSLKFQRNPGNPSKLFPEKTLTQQTSFHGFDNHILPVAAISPSPKKKDRKSPVLTEDVYQSLSNVSSDSESDKCLSQHLSTSFVSIVYANDSECNFCDCVPEDKVVLRPKHVKSPESSTPNPVYSCSPKETNKLSNESNKIDISKQLKCQKQKRVASKDDFVYGDNLVKHSPILLAIENESEKYSSEASEDHAMSKLNSATKMQSTAPQKYMNTPDALPKSTMTSVFRASKQKDRIIYKKHNKQ